MRVLFTILALVASSFGTVVSGTVTDPQGQAWYGGSYDFQLSPASGMMSGGLPLPTNAYHFRGVLDGSGSFSLTIPDNTTLAPADSYWRITICSQTSSPIETTGGSKKDVCFIFDRSISGATMSLTSTISSLVPTPLVNALLTPFAYNETELQTALGGMYFDINAGCVKFWNGSVWACLGGGGGGGVSTFSAGNLIPIFTSNVTNPTTTPALSFTLTNAAANTIFGNFTNSSGVPSYNSISGCGDSTHAVGYLSGTGFYCQALSAGGSVTNFTSGNLSPLFTTSVANSTTTPSLTFNLSNAVANTIYANLTGSLAAPSFSTTSIAEAVPTGFGTSGSPITNLNGTLTWSMPTSWTTGDLLLGNGSNSVARLPIGTSTYILTSNGTTASWQPNPSSGAGNCTTTGNAGECAFYPNDTTTGTTLNKAVRFRDNTTNQQFVRKFLAGDSFGWGTGIIGIVQSDAGLTGSAEICIRGRCNCQFSTAPTKGDLVQIDSAAGHEGECASNSGAGLNEDPQLHNFFARVHTTAGAGAVTDIDMLPVMSFAGDPAAASTIYPGVFPTIAPGSQFIMPASPLALETSIGNATTILPYVSDTTGFRIRNQSNANQAWDLYGVNRSGGDGEIILESFANGLTGGAFKIWCPYCNPTSYSHYTPVWTADVSGSQGWVLSAADTWNLRLTGNTTFSSFTFVNPGQISHWNLCQDATGGRTFTASAIIGLPTISSNANACTRFGTIAVDATHLYAFGGSSSGAGGGGSGIAVIYGNDVTAQTAAITDTTMYTPGSASVYRFTGTINCTTTSAAATATLNLKYTDTGNTAQTISITDTCTALVTSGIPNMVTAIRSKSGVAITWGVTIANTPTYDVSVRLEAM